jgi:hypothetical protein
MSDTKTDLERNVVNMAEDLEYLIRLINEVTDDRAEQIGQFFEDHYGITVDDRENAYWPDVAQQAIEESILEFKLHGTRGLSDEEWQITGVDVVFAIGGPHIELDTRAGAVMGYWGGDRARMGVTSAVTDYFEQLAEVQ